MAASSMEEERGQLTTIINHWNSIQSDLFAITLPDENLEFFGVMKFCYKEGSDHIATKCIRVACTATTQLVIKALIEKFRPDMRMLLGANSYALYECHDNVERQLNDNEKPLLVQLHWVSKSHHGNNNDGSFIFRRNLGASVNDVRVKGNKKLSKMEKKELKAIAKREKRERKERKKLTKKLKGSNKSLQDLDHTDNEDNSPSRAPSRSSSLWGEDSRLVRSLSNPEAVLRRRRHQKNSRSRESTPANEPIRVYADTVTNDNTCHTVLLSSHDTCHDVIGDLLNQFGLTRENPSDYRLIVVSLFGENKSPNGQVLAPGDSPLLNNDGEGLVYHLRHIKDIPQHHGNSLLCPLLVEVWSSEDDGRRRQPRRVVLSTESTEIGSGRGSHSASRFVCLTDRGVRPRHCVLAMISGRYTISPLDKHAETFVNGEMIVEPTFIAHGAIVAFGRHCSFRFVDPVSQSAAAAAAMATTNSNLVNTELSRHSTGNLLRESNYYSQDTPTLSNASRALSQPLDNFPNSVPQPVVLTTTRASTLNRISGSHERPADMIHRRSQSVQPNFVPVHSDDDDDDDDGNHRQHHKLHSSKDSSILSSEFSDTDYLLLPATLSFHPTQEGALLTGLISDTNCDDVKFKLSPAFTLYFIAKHHLSLQYQPGLHGGERKKHLLVMMKNSISLIKRAVKGRDSASLLAFWMANVSELLQFFKRDSDLALLSGDYETPLVKLIQQCFKHFCQCVLRELCLWLPALLDASPEADSEDAYVSHDDESCDMEPDIIHIGRSAAQQKYSSHPTIGRVLMTLSSTMSLLKRHHVNPGLNIQIFSILFRAICVTVFNQVVGTPGYCHQAWGIRLRERLARIESWAERQGLERTTSSQLSLVVQAAELLQCPEAMVNGTSLYKGEVLNSVQIHTLLSHYYGDSGPLPRGLVDKLVAMAKATVDVRILAEGRRITLQEEVSFNYLSDFRLPNCGYSCEGHRDIPSGFLDYLQPFINAGLCDFQMNGEWRRIGSAHSMAAFSAPSPISFTSSVSTMDNGGRIMDNGGRSHHRSNATESDHMSKSDAVETPKIMCITVSKVKQSLGISIGGGRRPRGNLGIFVWSIAEGGAIHRDGRLEIGDQLLRVDDQSLMNCSQDEAVRILQDTGNTFTLTVAKRAADFYGISYNIPSTKVSSLDRHGDHHGDHQSAKSSFALKAERRRRREEQMKQHQGSNSNSGGRKDSGMVLSIQKVSSLDESTASSCQSPVTNSNPQLTRWIMEQKRLQAERLSSHSSSRPTKLDATSDRESPMCYHDDSDNSSLCNSYTSGSRSYREGTKPQPDRDTPPELLHHDSNGLHGSWKRHKSIDESNRDDGTSHHTPKYQQEPSQDFPDHYGNQVNLSMDVQPSQLTNNSLPSSAAVLESSLMSSGRQRVGSGKMKQIMEHEPSSPVMVDDEPLKKEEYHHHSNKEAGLHLEAKSSRDAMPTAQVNNVNMKAADVQQMAFLMQLQQQQQQQQQPSRATGSQSDSDTVIDGDGSQEDARKHKLHQLIIELEEKKRELERLEQDKANEERKLAIEEQRYTEQEIKDEQMALRMGQPMSVEISRKRRRRELQKKRDEAGERVQLLEFDKHRVRTKMLVLEKNVEELRAIIEQDQKMGSHDQKMGSHERTGSLDQRMLYERTGSHDHSRIEYQRMGSHDARLVGGAYERTGSRMEYQRMGSHDGRIGPYERTGSHDQKRGRSRPPSAQAHNKEVSHDLPPASPRFHHIPSAFVSTSPKLRRSPVMVPVTTEPYMMPRHVPMTTRASPITQQQNMGRASLRGTMGSPYKELDSNLSRKKSRSRDLEEITSLSNKSVSETPSPYPVSMVTRDNVDDRHGKGHDPSSSTVTRKDSTRSNKPKSLFMSTTTLNDQPNQSQRSNPPNKTKPTSYRNSRPHNNTLVDANSLANLERTMKSPVSNSTTPTTPTLLRQHLNESTNGGNSGRHCYSKSTGGEANPHSYSRMEQDPTRSEVARETPQWLSHAKSHHHGNQISRNIGSLNSHHRNHGYQPEEEGSSDETCPRRDMGESPAAPDVIQSTFTSSYMSSCSPDGVGTSASPSPELPAADNLYSPVVPAITSLTLSCSQQYSPPHSPPAAFHRHRSPLVKLADHQLPWEHKQPRALSPQRRTSWEHQTHPTKLVAKDTTHPGILPLPSNRRTPVHMYPGTDL